MNAIYDKLLSELSNSYQFLHQKAKGKLIIAQVQVKNRNRYMANRTLTEAVYNITRAQDLASQYPDAKNIDETLLHMAYTKGRIFIVFLTNISLKRSMLATSYTNCKRVQNTIFMIL